MDQLWALVAHFVRALRAPVFLNLKSLNGTLRARSPALCSFAAFLLKFVRNPSFRKNLCSTVKLLVAV
jgi:hypothetical protein